MTKRINISIDENLYSFLVEMARVEKRTPANLLSLIAENSLRAHMYQQQQQQQQQQKAD